MSSLSLLNNSNLTENHFDNHVTRLHGLGFKVAVIPIVVTTVISYSRPIFLNFFSYFIIGTLKAAFTPKYHSYTWTYYHFSANAYQVPLLWKVSKMSVKIGFSLVAISLVIRLVHHLTKTYFLQGSKFLEIGVLRIGSLADRMIHAFSYHTNQVIQKIVGFFEKIFSLFFKEKNIDKQIPENMHQTPKQKGLSLAHEPALRKKAIDFYLSGHDISALLEIRKLEEEGVRDYSFNEIAVHLTRHGHVEEALKVVDNIVSVAYKKLALEKMARAIDTCFVADGDQVPEKLQKLLAKKTQVLQKLKGIG